VSLRAAKQVTLKPGPIPDPLADGMARC